MRLPIALLSCLALAGCAGPLPKPDPDMAWVDLHAQVGDTFMADRLDGKRVSDGRYFQVSPGRHTLEASYEYEVARGGLALSEPQYIRCRMEVEHEFQAGERYLFEAYSLGFTPVVRLKDSQGQVLARAERSLCL